MIVRDWQVMKHYGPLFWLHVLVILLLLSSWLFLPWWFIIIGVIMWHIQLWLLGGCFLSKWEFGQNTDCIPHYLHMWGLKIDKRVLRYAIRYLVPVLIILASLLWQIVLHHNGG